MTIAFDIARKELRTAFDSAVAVLFLGVFLLAALLGFFTFSSFFARNLADVRPLFEWLPLLLILLVSSVTMRQWAEERKIGTLEVLLTLPVRTRDLVLGKFLAGLALVALALALTFPLPITVSMLGELDWGPVIGGYVGALLLGAAYLSIGLCVSARTDNQVVSLIVTLLLGGLLYMVGSDSVAAFFSTNTADVLRHIGTGSRFTSIERGVLDLRDLLYYGSLTGFFLTLNVHFLEEPRVDAAADPRRIWTRRLTIALLGLNVIALNVWLSPVTALRVDMTKNGEYSISNATKTTLSRLEEPLYIDAYFSERTHPLLAPLVPQIRDLLAEYEVAGKGKIHVTESDPGADEELAQKIGEQYGLRSVPFGVTDRNSQSVINAWFHLLIRYGDKFESLSFEDLVDVDASSTGVDVRLRNLEYDLTRTIRRVSQDFQTVDALLARLPDGAKMTLYTSPETLPEDFRAPVDLLRKVAADTAGRSEGRLPFAEVDPTKDQKVAGDLDKRLGVRPLAADLFARKVFYAHLVIEAGGKVERLMPRGDAMEADLKKALEASLKRLSPGQLKTVAIYTETPEAPPQNPQIPPQFQPPTPEADYQVLNQRLAADFAVETVDLEESEFIPEHVDVLIIGKAGKLSDKAQFAIDQFLMRGGAVVALTGAWQANIGREGLSVVRSNSSLLDLLAAWGVTVKDALVLDPQNASFPVPVREKRGPFVMERIEMLPYPFFPDIRHDGFLAGHPALASLPNATVPWASPLEAKTGVEGVENTVLLETTEKSWLKTDGNIDPDFQKWPNVGFGVEGDTARRTVAVLLAGKMPSYFADKPSPVWESDDAGPDADRTGRTLKAAVPEARLAVIGSSEIVSDLMLRLAGQMTGEVHRANLQLLENLVDWAVEDTDLLEIRSSGAFARTLVPLTDAERRRWEWTNYALTLAALCGVVLVPRWLRRTRKPIRLALAQEGR